MGKIFASALFVVMMAAGFAVAQQTKYTGTINKLAREWIFYVPQGLPSSPPLVFCLQGCCSDYTQWATQSGYNKIADTAKIVVCYPQATSTSTKPQINDRDWDVTGDKDLIFILALIDTAVKKYNVDQTRIYATGFSYGGCFSNYLGCVYPDKFAAIAPSAGYVMTLELKDRNCKSTRTVPVLHMHGTKDNVVAYSSGVKSVAYWVKFNECPQTAQVTNNYQGSSTVKKEYYGPCKNNTEVIFLSAEGMGHEWMSQSKVGVNAAAESWNFMSKYKLPLPVAADPSIPGNTAAPSPLVARYHGGTISLHGVSGASLIRLVDVQGRVARSWSGFDDKRLLSTGQLSSGIYLLMVSRGKSSTVIPVICP
jgi:poly(3-hydroxybutyrate) depolymerase